MTTITFTHIGKPQSKGAHTSFIPRRRDGSMVTRRDGAPMVVTKDTNPKQEQAQRDLATTALVARSEAGEGVWLSPVVVTMRFYFDRNKGHYGTGRNAGVIKESAPAHPVTAPDLDKLERQVLDALTGVIVRDDQQVVQALSSKHYVEGDQPARTEVEVSAIEQQTVGMVVADEQMALAA
jgi:Holliday junction resolvase RusA-like endonuclease